MVVKQLPTYTLQQEYGNARCRESLVDVTPGVGVAAIGGVSWQACVVGVAAEAGVVRLACPVQIAWLCIDNSSHESQFFVQPSSCTQDPGFAALPGLTTDVA